MTAAALLTAWLVGPLPVVGSGDEPVHVWQQARTKAPDATFRRLDGSPQRLADLKGKVVVLDFWTTWCLPCVEEIPEMTAFHDWARSRDDVALFTVNDDSDAGALSRFLAAKKPAFPVLLMGRANPLKITGYPTKILIDADGLVRLRRWGGPVPAAELQEKALSLIGPARDGGSGRRGGARD